MGLKVKEFDDVIVRTEGLKSDQDGIESCILHTPLEPGVVVSWNQTKMGLKESFCSVSDLEQFSLKSDQDGIESSARSHLSCRRRSTWLKSDQDGIESKFYQNFVRHAFVLKSDQDGIERCSPHPLSQLQFQNVEIRPRWDWKSGIWRAVGRSSGKKGWNQTKMGLKAPHAASLFIISLVEIRPRWDWKIRLKAKRRKAINGWNQTKMGLKGIFSAIIGQYLRWNQTKMGLKARKFSPR